MSLSRAARRMKNRFVLWSKYPSTFGRTEESNRLLNSYLSANLLPARSDREHLDAGMDWLLEAQKACNGRGVAAKLEVTTGWTGAYPETSGYIIASYLQYDELFKKPEFTARAIELGDWEIEIQREDGAVRSDLEGSHVRVFNTGQVMLGWCMLFERMKERRFLEAAERAGRWLVSTQDADGRWTQNTYCGARTYHARVDWPLLWLADLTGKREYEDAARRNLNWITKCVRENGWIENCGFNSDDPITHVLDYTLRGLLESHARRPQWGLLEPVLRSIRPFLEETARHPVRGVPGMVPQAFAADWASDRRTSCLTGNAQFAYLLYRLNQITPDEKFVRAADQILEATKRTQATTGRDPRIRGAVPGCFPFFEGYCRNSYPNWATKFFVDALMMKMNQRTGFRVDA